MLHVFLLLHVHIVIGLSPKRNVATVPLFCRNTPRPASLVQQYCGKPPNVPVFVVESQVSYPVRLRIDEEQVVHVFMDPNDAVNFLTELAQTDVPGKVTCSTLRIRVMDLVEWFERADPTKTRTPSRTAYKLVPSSKQLSYANTYIPLSSSHNLFVPLFFSKRLTVAAGLQCGNTLLFLDMDDLMATISTLGDDIEREAALNSIGVISLLDLILETPDLHGYSIVPSRSSLEFCRRERYSPNVMSRAPE